MVISVLALLAAGITDAAGVILAAPRWEGPGLLRLDVQQNYDHGVPVWDLGLAAGAARGVSLAYELMVTERRSGRGGLVTRERFTEHQGAAGATLRRFAGRAPGEILLAAGVSDSAYLVWTGGAPPARGGERVLAGEIAAWRRLGPVRAGMSGKGASSFYKAARRTLRSAAVGLALRLAAPPLGTLRAEAFAEAAPFLVNPAGLPAAWSLGLSLEGGAPAGLSVFATNTYGSTLANSFHGLPWTLYGFRLTRVFAGYRHTDPSRASAQ